MVYSDRGESIGQSYLSYMGQWDRMAADCPEIISHYQPLGVVLVCYDYNIFKNVFDTHHNNNEEINIFT